VSIAAALLALFWGVFWALFLQFSPTGRWLALRRTWLTVVAGVGVDLLILLLVLPLDAWLTVAGVFALSGIGLIARSLWNEYHGDAYDA